MFLLFDTTDTYDLNSSRELVEDGVHVRGYDKVAQHVGFPNFLACISTCPDTSISQATDSS